MWFNSIDKLATFCLHCWKQVFAFNFFWIGLPVLTNQIYIFFLHFSGHHPGFKLFCWTILLVVRFLQKLWLLVNFICWYGALQITNKCLPSVLKLQHLEDLVLEGCFGIDDDSVAALKHGCKSLKVCIICWNTSSWQGVHLSLSLKYRDVIFQ